MPKDIIKELRKELEEINSTSAQILKELPSSSDTYGPSVKLLIDNAIDFLSEIDYKHLDDYRVNAQITKRPY